jgi:hypothetical protein
MSEDLTFHFQKSTFFRTIHVDGAFGGVTPQGKISISFYSERFPIPQSTTHTLVGTKLSPEKHRETKNGIIREVEVNCTMDVANLEALVEFLEGKLKELKKQPGVDS